MVLHYLDCGDTVRIWTDEQARYGQFTVIDADELDTVRKVLGIIGWTLVESTD